MEWVFDHLPQLYQVILAIAGAFGFAVYLRSELLTLRSDISQIKESQKLMTDSLKQLNTILTQIAVQGVRLDMIEKDIDELRHGHGYIK